MKDLLKVSSTLLNRQKLVKILEG